MILSINEIKELIPHREPFLFIDQCDILELGSKGIGHKKFLPSEFFFKGHFPNKPIVPGVILIEAMAQTAGVVVAAKFENKSDNSVLFMSVSMAKFRKPVFPEYEIFFNVECINRVKTVYKFKGEAFHQNIKVSEAQFSAMISHS